MPESVPPSSTADLIVVGAGSAGLPCAITAAEAGARVVVCEKSDRPGGTLHVSGGHISAAGTRRQRERGIDDDPDDHFADVMKIGGGSANVEVLRRAVDQAGETLDWLEDLGFEHADASPRIVYGHEPYSAARTYYGTDEARSILEVLVPRFDALIAQGAIEVWYDTAVRGLEVDADGAVVGIRAAGPDGPRAARAPATVLATGGYGAAPDRFEALEGFPLYTVAPETSTGDGLELAEQAGGVVVAAGRFLPTFGGLPAGQPNRVLWPDRPHLVAAERPPWELYVDPEGERFVAEDEPSIDVKERLLMERVPGMTFHLVFDARALREGPPILVGHTSEEVAAAFDTGRAGFATAPSLDELGRIAGIDPAGLAATVEDYNGALAADRPDALGRAHRPAPVAEPPFFAIRNHGSTLITFGGVDVDGDLRVRTHEGRPVPGLYAAGEVIGAGATMGDAFCGGMALMPALTFGRHLGGVLAAGGER